MRICDNCLSIIPRPERHHDDQYEWDYDGAMRYDLCNECHDANVAEDHARTKVLDASEHSRIVRMRRSAKDFAKKHGLNTSDWGGAAE